MWLYGCYSNDTQVLTDKGWKYFYELDKTEKILQWDSEKDILSWVKPLNYFEYDIDDEMILLENRHTSQLLSKNHNVYARVQKNERKQVNGIRKYISKKDEKYQPYKAEDLKNNWNISLPLASRLDGNLDCEYAYMLGWWVTDAWKHNDGKACMFSQSKPKTLLKLRNELDRLKQLGKCNYSEYVKDDKNLKHNKEHTFYVTGEVADWLLNNYSDRELNWNLLNFNLKNKQQLLEGLMDGDGSYRKNSYSKIFWSQKENRCDIISALLTCLGYRNYIFNKGRHQGVVFNSVHSSTEISYKHRKPLQEYHGKIYCLETETGAFVVRRNGKPFISGNSGFPKSMNIGLAMDKREGVESKIVGQNHDILKKQAKDLKEGHRKIVDSFNAGAEDRNNGFTTVSADIKEPVSEDGKKWKGWGTQLKPSFEPIIVARKPFKGSLVDNIIKYGVGGINIDECRIPLEGDYEYKETNRKPRDVDTVFSSENSGFDATKNKVASASPSGRFPTNTILTYDDTDYDEVCGGFPIGGQNGNIDKRYKMNNQVYGDYGYCNTWQAYNDSGSAARYFMNCKYTGKDEKIWKQLLVNNVENNLEILKATKDNIVQMNVEDLLKELKDHYAKYVDNQLDLIETPIVQDIVEILTWDFKIGTSQVIQDFIINSKKCIQFLNLVQFVEKMDNIDTTQTTQNLLKLFGYAKVVITNYIQGNIEYDQKRYIYTPKASRKDRDEGLDDFELKQKVFNGKSNQSSIDIKDVEQRFTTECRNIHPTVKPTELMQYLVRLVTPKGGIVLDPFMGSGSTGKATMYENKERKAKYKFIGIELSPEYVKIAEARISHAIEDYYDYSSENATVENIQNNIDKKVKTSDKVLLW